jgi:hypothetical protein
VAAEPPRDVYSPPRTAVADPGPSARSPGWLVYSWILAIWFAYGLVDLALDGAELKAAALVIRVATAVVYTFALFGVWGYARGVRLSTRNAWAGCLLLLALQLFMLGRAVVLHLLDGADPASYDIALPAGFGVLLLPMAWALWRYAFRSPQVWAPARPGSR